MKKLVFLISFILCSSTVFSQFVPVPSWGAKGGINIADIGGDEADNAMKLAFAAGLYGQKHFNAFWHINVELLLSGQGHGAKDDFSNKLNLLYLNLPIIVEYAPSFNLGFHAGLQPGLILSAKSKFQDTTSDVKDQFNTVDLGLVLGGSYYLMDKKVAITLRYILGFTSLSSDEFTPNPPTRYNRVIQITASYMIARLFEE